MELFEHDPAQLSTRHQQERLQGSKLQVWPRDPEPTPTRSGRHFSKSGRHLPGHVPGLAVPAESFSLQLFCFIFLAALCLLRRGLKENKNNKTLKSCYTFLQMKLNSEGANPLP